MNSIVNQLLIALGTVVVMGVVFYPLYLFISGVTQNKGNLIKFKAFMVILSILVGYVGLSSMVFYFSQDVLKNNLNKTFALVSSSLLLGFVTAALHPILNKPIINAYKSLGVNTVENQISTNTNYFSRFRRMLSTWYLPITAITIIIELIFNTVFKSEAGYVPIVMALILFTNQES